MKRHVDALVRTALREAIDAGEIPVRRVPAFSIDTPTHPAFGELACDVAMLLAREARQPPPVVAAALIGRIRDPGGWLADVDVAGPGFLNFRFTPAFWCSLLADALAQGERYGRTGTGAGTPVQVTLDGPADARSLDDGRRAAVADGVARLLDAVGHQVTAGPDDDGGGGGRVVAVVRVHRPRHSTVASPGDPDGDRAGRPPSRRLVAVGPVRLTRGGEAVRANGRPGDVPGLPEVRAEVGPDATRFFFLLGKADSELDFDLELAKKQSADNPVFYVQYAYARLAGVLRRATPAAGVPAVAPDLTTLDAGTVDALRVLAAFPDVVEGAARALEPQRIAEYATRVASAVHRTLNRDRLLTADEAPTPARLALLRCFRQVLRGALDLTGVPPPERM